ncbi:coiled-coil domain-containing protein 62-like [Liolophura sinensis]|uniref:coiled-coil domain-containing protein 62-like n=1 Tax=Liolophura sinensis TaxID=3198878 RepID=UPI0031592FD1
MAMFSSTSTSGNSPLMSGGSFQPQHSTPVKAVNEKGSAMFPAGGADVPTPVQSAVTQPSPAERDINTLKSCINHTSALSRDGAASKGVLPRPQGSSSRGTARVDFTSGHQQVMYSTLSEGEMGIIQKQRQELQLLISELRDRDRELNSMVSAHQTQLLAWEEDRQKLLTAEHKSAHYESDIKEYKKSLNKLAAYVKTLKEERQKQMADFQKVRDELNKMSQENGNQSMQLNEFQMKDRNMSENVKALSNAIGQLEARETELTTLVKIKDKELCEATVLLNEMRARLSQMDLRCKEAHELVLETQRQAKDWKHKYTELKRDHGRLRENFNSVMTQSQSSLQEMEESRRKISDLERELALAGERECRTKDMMESLKSKQERSAQELTTLRQLYDRQQRELSLLQLNLDSSQDIIEKQQVTLSKSQSDPGLQLNASSTRTSCVNSDGIPEVNADGLEYCCDGMLTSQNEVLSPPNAPAAFDLETRSPVAHKETSTPHNPLLSTQPDLMSGSIATSAVAESEDKETSLEEERQKFDELYMKFLQDPDCPGTAESSLISMNTVDLEISVTSGREESVSPTSKLHRLLAESRLMVQKLEQSTITHRGDAPTQVEAGQN